MTPEEMAEIHVASFITPRPWSATEITDLLAAQNTHLFSQKQGFALLRIAGPEAEILTIAVHPAMRRQNIAKTLLAEAHAFAKTARVEEVFLEVADQNHAAIALYESAGYTHQGIRKDYYTGPKGEHISAIVMSRTI